LSTREVMATGVMFNHPETLPEDPEEPVYFAPMIDARRMEVFTGVYDMALTPVMEPQPLILDATSYADILERGRVVFFGDGSAKSKEVINHPNAVWIDDINPLASDMLALSERAVVRGDFADTAYTVPLYLKEFQATKPKRPFN
ncbi:MAG: tRNA (adenosine(37)-N6)-threonylcarbamoyltransferase complex dimerization subunit type 1 TsaB, partial [Muribaculaceae bacterium]|nr:tRNA (adenosine(37)-N6)-threonylcarbamoyltransferase complex dimerization subunit type 1 TsaB [Muribaculaceae bacterium]